ncbi:hypothetical protein KIN20_026268 [Parelaphostrongylus tenuis]|uniref:Uncharacterized protein n=1 Tax=Parelaphostrongylus tenuis TaxID=148309 RepID=A0AAD5MZF1_PARTN|nr:hypothetical protein KIN20_026268 [Parelaphostrongylus tenuis]
MPKVHAQGRLIGQRIIQLYLITFAPRILHRLCLCPVHAHPILLSRFVENLEHSLRSIDIFLKGNDVVRNTKIWQFAIKSYAYPSSRNCNMHCSTPAISFGEFCSFHNEGSTALLIKDNTVTGLCIGGKNAGKCSMPAHMKTTTTKIPGNHTSNSETLIA